MLIFVAMADIKVVTTVRLDDGSKITSENTIRDINLDDDDVIVESRIEGKTNGGPFPRPARPRIV